MATTKEMVTITRVTDDETGLYHMGEIDGLFQQDELLDFFTRYGGKGKTDLIEHLAYLQHQVVEAWRIHQQRELWAAAKQKAQRTSP